MLDYGSELWRESSGNILLRNYRRSRSCFLHTAGGFLCIYSFFGGHRLQQSFFNLQLLSGFSVPVLKGKFSILNNVGGDYPAIIFC